MGPIIKEMLSAMKKTQNHIKPIVYIQATSFNSCKLLSGTSHCREMTLV